MGCCGCRWRAPRQLRYVAPAVVFALIGWLYGSFTHFAQPLLLLAGVSAWELAAFHVMTLLLCASLARCLLSRESFVPRNTLARGQTPEPQLGAGAAVESKMNGDVRFCRKCRAVKPDRAHHCSTCRRCVLKMDHHCVYINKCGACGLLVSMTMLGTYALLPGAQVHRVLQLQVLPALPRLELRHMSVPEHAALPLSARR